MSIAVYAVAIIAPFLGDVGAVICGLGIAGVALLWFVPDRRVERVLSADG